MTKTKFQSGAKIDTRPLEEKKKDFKFAELVAGADPVNWVLKTPDQYRKFPIFNQNGSGSCVAQTEAKELGIMRAQTDGVYVHFSATDIYQRRINKDGSGMGGVDARTIASEGVTLEALTPSQGMHDAEMDAAVVEPYKREIGKVFAVPNFAELIAGDIETVASIIQRTKKGVMVWFYFKYDEWDTNPKVLHPDLVLNAPDTCRHSVTAVDFTLLPNGKKALIIEDSWGPNAGLGGQRIIDEDFFKARNWYASYLTAFKFQIPAPTPIGKPIHTFNTDMEFSVIVTYTPEVMALQDCLKFEGLYPANVSSSGYFGAITKKAVQQFQAKYNITTSTSTGYGRVGPKTRAQLNLLYSK